MEQFFDRGKMDSVVTKSVNDLVAPTGLDQHLQFTARRGKALLAHTQAVANVIGERVKQLWNGMDVTLASVQARVARLESMLEPPVAGGPTPALLEDQITQHGVRLDRLQQLLSAMSKQISALDRKTNR